MFKLPQVVRDTWDYEWDTIYEISTIDPQDWTIIIQETDELLDLSPKELVAYILWTKIKPITDITKGVEYRQTNNGAYDVFDAKGFMIAQDVSLEYAQSLCKPTIFQAIVSVCETVSQIFPEKYTVTSTLNGKLLDSGANFNPWIIENFLIWLDDSDMHGLNPELTDRVKEICDFLSSMEHVIKGRVFWTTKHGMYSVLVLSEVSSNKNIILTKSELNLLWFNT